MNTTEDKYDGRSCKNCRNWYEPAMECRVSHPYMEGWPRTKAEDFCWRFRPDIGIVRGNAPKVSDEKLIEMVRKCATAELVPDGSGRYEQHGAYRRASLVFEMMDDYGMSRTAALKRIETMVRRGVFEQGPNPTPDTMPTKGIHVWLPELTAGRVGGSGQRKGSDLLYDEMEILAYGEGEAKSLRELHRRVGDKLGASLTTFSRWMGELVDRGRVVNGPNGYHITDDSVATKADVTIDVD